MKELTENDVVLLNGFPLYKIAPYKEERDKKMVAMFGIESQGRYKFIERALKNGAGWGQIAEMVGWMASSIISSYYMAKYKTLFSDMGLLMVDLNEDKNKGWVTSDNTTGILTLNESSEFTSGSFFDDKIRSIQFMINDKEKYDKSNKKVPILNIERTGELTGMTYHVKMKKESGEITISRNILNDLILKIIEFQEEGYERISNIFFDEIIAPEEEKIAIYPPTLKRLKAFYKELI